MLTGLQIRAARSALKMSVLGLSQRSGVSVRTIKRMEAENKVPSSTLVNLNAVKVALQAAGIEFIGTPDDRPGIRINRPNERP